MADEKFSNFLTEIIDADLAEGKVKEIHTRFPPEPFNRYMKCFRKTFQHHLFGSTSCIY